MRYSQLNAIYIENQECLHACLYVRMYVRNAVTFHHCLFLEQIHLYWIHTHNSEVHIVCCYVCACVGGKGGILCLTISRSTLILSCLFSDVVKNAIMDAFQIPEGKECRLWHRYMTNSYEQVGGEVGREQRHSESSVG